jgi:hypothetical protein
MEIGIGETYKGHRNPRFVTAQAYYRWHCGTILHNGKTYILTADAEPTGRQLDGCTNYHEAEEGQEYSFEMSAKAMDHDNNAYAIYWIFDDIKGQERDGLDEYDYSKIDRIERREDQ